MKRICLAIGCGLLAVIPLQADESAYAGLESRKIKALSEADVEGYLEGRGMGFAMAAELNSYPGPKHVLELAEALELSADQIEHTRGLFDAMLERAVDLGAQLVERERALDAAFAERTADERTVKTMLADLGRVRAELRFAHLNAHLAMRGLLSDAQVLTYDRLRGYGSANPDCPHGGSGPRPEGHAPRQDHAGHDGF